MTNNLISQQIKNSASSIPSEQQMSTGHIAKLSNGKECFRVFNGQEWVSFGQSALVSEMPPASEFGQGSWSVGQMVFQSDGIKYECLGGEIICLKNSGVKVNLTGTTAQTLMAQASLPDGCMGPNSTLRIEPKWTHENDANNKTMFIGIGVDAADAIATGSIYNVTRGTGFAGSAPLLEFVNRGVTNSQLRKYSDLSVYSPGNSSSAEQTSTIDFSRTGLSVYFFGTLANASNNLALQGYTVTLVNGYA